MLLLVDCGRMLAKGSILWILQKNLNLEQIASFRGIITEPEQCPLCKHAISPQEFYITSFTNNNGEKYITALYLCKHCYQSFVTLYTCRTEAKTEYGRVVERTYRSNLLYCGPSQHEKRDFQKSLAEVSPRFVDIYNQASAAENYGLNEICGIGYRKSLEFLVKDYLIHKEPDQRETIESMELGNCIANKITDEDLKTVASRCAWIGNDETHYYRRFEEYDVGTLKQLLEATIYWVSMKLTTEMADEIERRR